MFGYYGFFLGLQYQNERTIARALDAGVLAEFQEITIKIPMSVPYMPDQSGFERVSGKFEHEGELFRLVKQKYAKDTLTVVCIKDVEHKKIDQSLAEYASAFSDISSTEKSLKAPISFSKEYLPLVISIRSVAPGWVTTVGYRSINQDLISLSLASISQPPEVV